MPISFNAALRYLLCAPALLLVACTVPTGTPPPVSVQDVRAVEIHYHYSGWERADEVHRLQRGPGQRTFTRTSMTEAADGVETTRATVPAQRVGELLWALSAPPWPRARAVQVVARRVHPAGVMAHAAIGARHDASACTADQIRDRMFGYLGGAALRTQLDTYYQSLPWTDDDPMMRVVIAYNRGPDKVISSRSQKLLMLPWTLGDHSAPGREAAPQSWSVPVSDALRRLLPAASQAAERLGDDTSVQLAGQVAHAAEQACARERGAVRAPP